MKETIIIIRTIIKRVLKIVLSIAVVFISIMAPEIIKQSSAPVLKLSEKDRAINASVCEQIERMYA